jgi:hypothetical protein
MGNILQDIDLKMTVDKKALRQNSKKTLKKLKNA